MTISCKKCKHCKHCEKYDALDYEYLCPEPSYRCRTKKREILFISLPRPFCKSFEPKPSYEEVYKKACSTAINELTDVYRKCGGNAESVSKTLARLARMETEYKNVTTLRMLEDKLEPCPICGGKPRVQMTTDYKFDLGEQHRYDIACPRRCGPILGGLNLDCLIESWNRYTAQVFTKSTIEPKSTNCPNCGAPIDIHAEKCAYCDTPYI